MKYRLKPEAVPFFKKDLSTSIYDLSTWKQYQVDVEALEKVEDTYIKYGIPMSKSGDSLSGWSEKDGAHFHFTIHYPSVKYCEYDKFSNGKHTRELMNKIQNTINYFYSDFVNEVK